MLYRVAIASTDGIIINQHFGHTERFHIVELNTDTLDYQFIESRTVERVCQGHYHEEKAFDAVLSVLSDVQAILVQKIGQGASDYLESKGIRVYTAPFPIEPVIQKILKDKFWEVDSWLSHMKN